MFRLVMLESKILVKRLTLSFVLIFPFTFIPVLKEGNYLNDYVDHLPVSTRYAAAFSLLAVLIAFIQDYITLNRRKALFDKPAFRALEFYLGWDEKGDLTKEISPFLFGKYGDFFFKIIHLDTYNTKFKIKITPLINWHPEASIERYEKMFLLKKKFMFKGEGYLFKEIILDSLELNDQYALIKELTEINKVLQRMALKGEMLLTQ